MTYFYEVLPVKYYTIENVYALNKISFFIRSFSSHLYFIFVFSNIKNFENSIRQAYKKKMTIAGHHRLNLFFFFFGSITL